MAKYFLMKNLIYLCSLFLMISCSTTSDAPDYSQYPIYERDIPNTFKSGVEPGTVLNCYYDSGGGSSYYFGIYEEEEKIVRIVDLTNEDVLSNQRRFYPVDQFVTLASDLFVSMRENERPSMSCPYRLVPGSSILATIMYDRTILINKKFLTFQQQQTNVFLDRTDSNNPVCRQGRTTTSKGYCKVVEGFDRDYEKFIQWYTFPSSQL